MGSLRMSTAVVAAFFVCLSIMQSSTVAQFAPPMILCATPYGLCTSADPSGVVCNERCLNAEGRNYVYGVCMTNPGTCMCCYTIGV
uniref:Knottin scorpion toxin-like domain-containing protein n=1 Tax=Brassica oleracea var. oleracea TaxID=109376 RepID=A0A0D3A544_BRAOL